MINNANFTTLIWRRGYQPDQVTDQVADQVTPQLSEQVHRLVLVLKEKMSRQELMQVLQLKHNQSFRENYLYPAIKERYIEMTMPENPNDPNQKYRLTELGKILAEQLIQNTRKSHN